MPVDNEGNLLDPQIVALAQAIRQRETPEGKQVKGQTGEIKSRFQFLENTWANLAEQHLGDRNAEVTEAHENEVVYKELKRLADGPYTIKEKKQSKKNTAFRDLLVRGIPAFPI